MPGKFHKDLRKNRRRRIPVVVRHFLQILHNQYDQNLHCHPQRSQKLHQMANFGKAVAMSYLNFVPQKEQSRIQQS